MKTAVKKKQKHGKISTTGLHLHTSRRLWRWSWSVWPLSLPLVLCAGVLSGRSAARCPHLSSRASPLLPLLSPLLWILITARLSSPERMQFLTKISVRRHIRDSVYCNQGHIYVVFDVKGVCASCEDLQYGWTGSIGTKRKLEDSDDDERLANWKREQKMLEWIFDGLL